MTKRIIVFTLVLLVILTTLSTSFAMQPYNSNGGCSISKSGNTISYSGNTRSTTTEATITVSVTLKGQTLHISGVDEPAASVPAGCMDETAFYRKSLTALSPIDPSVFNLLIAHRPEFIEDYAKPGFDLVVSGHCHGGQVRIPFLINGLYAPGQGLFPKYAGGQYQVKDTTLIISRGLHRVWHLPRVFNRPEAVKITLVPRK